MLNVSLGTLPQDNCHYLINHMTVTSLCLWLHRGVETTQIWAVKAFS